MSAANSSSTGLDGPSQQRRHWRLVAQDGRELPPGLRGREDACLRVTRAPEHRRRRHLGPGRAGTARPTMTAAAGPGREV
jgi:hypothetical protein